MEGAETPAWASRNPEKDQRKAFACAKNTNKKEKKPMQKITHVLNAKLSYHSKTIANYFALLSITRAEDDSDLLPFSQALSWAWDFCKKAIQEWNADALDPELPEIGDAGEWGGGTSLQDLWSEACDGVLSITCDDATSDTPPLLKFSVDVEPFDIDKIRDRDGKTIIDQVNIYGRTKDVLEAAYNLLGDEIWGRNMYFLSNLDNGDRDDVVFSDADDEEEGERQVMESVLEWIGDPSIEIEDLRGKWAAEKVFPPQSRSPRTRRNADTFPAA